VSDDESKHDTIHHQVAWWGMSFFLALLIAELTGIVRNDIDEMYFINGHGWLSIFGLTPFCYFALWLARKRWPNLPW
jgi:hypothetical protein